eukprot:6206640-Pleurochrysis_carterae.AAC.1
MPPSAPPPPFRRLCVGRLRPARLGSRHTRRRDWRAIWEVCASSGRSVPLPQILIGAKEICGRCTDESMLLRTRPIFAYAPLTSVPVTNRHPHVSHGPSRA